MTSLPRGSVLILDTSVALKWFLEKGEAEVAQARELRDAHLSGRCVLCTPDFLLLEIANALTLGRRSSIADVTRALRDIREIRLNLVELQFSTLAKAVELASAFGVTVYDSYFLAMAIESDALLVTADLTFIRKIGGHQAVASLGSLELH